MLARGRVNVKGVPEISRGLRVVNKDKARAWRGSGIPALLAYIEVSKSFHFIK
jgi:hypothetical protein